jgi:diguanylate cyclase (GGDEF)-like protein
VEREPGLNPTEPVATDFIEARHGRLDRGIGHSAWQAVLRMPPPVRIGLLSVLLATFAAILFLGCLVNRPAPARPPSLHPGIFGGMLPAVDPIAIAWLLITLGFCVTELKVVDVHFRRELHSFSLTEVPVVIGFFLLSPSEYFPAMLLGTGIALLIAGQPRIKLAFNLANFAFVAAAAMSIFYAIQGPTGEPDPRAWNAAFAGTLSAAILSSVSIATVISVSGGAPQFQKLPEMIQFGGLVAIANTSLALLAVGLLWIDPQLLALLVVPVLVVFLAYRAYVSEREKHEHLELLYQSSRILQHSPELDSALSSLLEHAREMFRAKRAEFLLWPRGDREDGLMSSAFLDLPATSMKPAAIAQVHPLHRRVALEHRAFLYNAPMKEHDTIRQAMVVPLLGESGLIGSMIIANRITEGTTFGEDDLRLLETLANQAAAALENGQLEQSLVELSRLKEELRYQAYHDPLTGLANRSLFAERVDTALARMDGENVPVVLFLDLDNFKDVNDSLGHATGDQLLTAVAERVRQCIRGDDLAARLGGDEFAVLLFDDSRLARAHAVATRIIESLAVTFPMHAQNLKVTASIGIAAGQEGLEHADDLLRNADVAMYTAKQGGKNRFAVFEPNMHVAIVARHALSTELSRGIFDGEIDVFYQPIMYLDSGVTYGAEALARWRHPLRGIVGPEEFIPLAEESGAILELGRAVLFEACREASTWRAPNGVPLTVTVNLSAAQLAQDDFVRDLVDIMRATGLPPERLVLEMTETVMFHDTETTTARLTALRDLGIRVAIDDFGTGYSSLGYLRRFPVDILKIAREFVTASESGPDGWTFARAIVALGRSLGLRIVAEGIETQEQLGQLREMGCELGQGFLFASPVTGEEAEAMFASWDIHPLLAPQSEPHVPAVVLTRGVA